ncbi:MAG: hypothetical protein PHE73_03515 [Sulfurovaceae bacterium]|nr:hypothetical protein [Sulfurovaceae bacterium]
MNKDRRTYLAVAKAIDAFGEKHEINGREHIARAIGLQGPNAAIQLSNILNTETYNPTNPKRLSIDHLLAIMFELDDDNNMMILNAIAEEFGYNITKAKSDKPNKTNVSKVFSSVLELNQGHGELSRVLNESIIDGEIDEDEKIRLQKEILDLKTAVRALEELVR